MSDRLRAKEHGWLRFNEPGEESWSFPDVTDEQRQEAAWKCRYAPEQLTQTERFLLAEAFEALHHLCTHPAGTKYTQGQLAAIRRVLKK